MVGASEERKTDVEEMMRVVDVKGVAGIVVGC